MLSRARLSAALDPATAPVSAATIHHEPPASQPRIQLYVIARGQPAASLLHSSPALHRSHHRKGNPKADTMTKNGILATAL